MRTDFYLTWTYLLFYKYAKVKPNYCNFYQENLIRIASLNQSFDNCKKNKSEM